MTRRRKLRIIKTTIAAVVLAIAVVGGLIYADRQYRAGSFEPQWRELCVSYVRWYKPFDRAEENDDVAALLERMKQDPYLAEHFLKPLQDAKDRKVTFDPRALGQPLPYEQQAANPPHGVEIKKQVLDALATLKSFEAALDATKWPAAVRLANAKTTFEQRGWLAPAQYCTTALSQFSLSGSPHLEKAIPAILDAQPLLDAIDARWSHIEHAAGEISAKASQDKLLSQYLAFAISQGMSRADAPVNDSLKTLADHLDDADKLGVQLLAFVNSPAFQEVDWEAFRADSRIYKHDSNLELAQALRLWPSEAAKYPVITTPDPRPSWKPEMAISQVTKEIATLTQLAGANAKLPQKSAPLAERLSAISTRLDQLRKLPWSSRNKLPIESGMAQVDRDLAQLASSSSAALVDAQNWVKDQEVAAKATFAEGLSALKSRKLSTSSPALLAAWNSHQARVLSLVKEGDIESLKLARKQLDETKAALEKLALELPEMRELPATQDWNTHAAAALRKLEAAQREAALAAAVQKLKFENELPVRDAQFDSSWQAGQSRLADWGNQAKAFMEDFNRIQQALELSYGLKEPLAGAGATIDQLSRKYPSLLDQDEIAKAAAPILSRLAELRKVESTSDRQELTQTALKASSAPAIWAAWRHLHEAAMAFPASAAELSDELTIRQRLSDSAAVVKDEKRRQTLEQQLSRSGPSTLANMITHASDLDGALALALSQKDKLGLRGEKGKLSASEMEELHLDATSRFNCFLFECRAAARALGASADPAAREQISQLIAELPKSDLPASTELAAGLSQLLTEKQETGTPVKSGPEIAAAEMPWKLVKSDAEGMTFKWGEQSLHFVKIDGGMDEQGKRLPTYYLCSTEMPVGLVSAVLAATGKSASEMNLPANTAAGKGPQGWITSARGIEPSAYWLEAITREAGGTYPQALLPSQAPAGRQWDRCLKDPFNPSAKMPMQSLPAESAMALAATLGCRLPTSAELHAAIPLQKQQPNLRDATWALEREHIKTVRANGRLGAPWPDTGMFTPTVAGLPAGPVATTWLPAQLHNLNLPMDGSTYDDGALFFRPVDSGDKVADVVGNVAEFVWDDPSAIEKAPDKSAAAFRKLIDASPKMIGVMGASAISAPEIGIGRQSLELLKLHQAFPDVGLRLAFSPAKRLLADRLRELVDGTPYFKK